MTDILECKSKILYIFMSNKNFNRSGFNFGANLGIPTVLKCFIITTSFFFIYLFVLLVVIYSRSKSLHSKVPIDISYRMKY